MRITVTETHIRHGKPGRSTGCPIALALMDLGYTPEVGAGAVYLRADDPEVGAWLPSVAQEFVDRFDRGEPVAPFAFDLRME